ncbi:hypothetical protein [Microscilla marina]|uniref:Uncharacterized protein n=1 Tax=Microscilla marina ATCC 23134 TaxID=313606 RepID=A1ZUK9_MICM2|nr:hypothetical protein [Microscilla marina]EAY25895.1 hypothetical protein M23134_00849 [Microscilla marina ATCC 23134]
MNSALVLIEPEQHPTKAYKKTMQVSYYASFQMGFALGMVKK